MLVYAGDFVYRGPAAAECVAIVEGCGPLADSPLNPSLGDVIVGQP